MSSDATGEIYVIVRNDGGSVNDASPTSGLPPTSTGSAPAASGTTAGADPAFGGGVGVRDVAAVVAFFMALPFA